MSFPAASSRPASRTPAAAATPAPDGLGQRLPAARVGGEVGAELDGLRGLAALLVVFNHLPAWHPALHESTFLRQSGLMVDLFFVLSGFVIHSAYAQRLHGPRALAGFMALRFARLYPLHLATLLFFGVIELARQHSAALGVARTNAGVYADATWGVFIEHLLLIQAVPPFHDILSFNSPSWSIGVEFYTYLIFGLCVWGLGARAPWALGALLAAGTALLLSQRWPDSQHFVRGVSGFAAGALVAAWRGRAAAGETAGDAAGTVPAWVSEALLLAIVLVVWQAEALPLTWRGLPVMALTAAFILAVCARRAGRPGPCARLMRSRPAHWLGVWSFTVYLMHGPVLWIMNNVARHVLKWPEAMVGGSWKPQASLAGALGWTALSLVVTVALSALVWRVYEAPAREAIRRLALRRLGLGGGLR